MRRRSHHPPAPSCCMLAPCSSHSVHLPHDISNQLAAAPEMSRNIKSALKPSAYHYIPSTVWVAADKPHTKHVTAHTVKSSATKVGPSVSARPCQQRIVKIVGLCEVDASV